MASIREDAVDEQVTLASYADQVRELIRHDRNDEAVAICKHILRYYPKYIDAYRQLGEALLEKRDYESARDVFRRVLSADPENAIAYVGLSTIFEQEQLVNEAVWNMERAFELTPGNAEVQKELARLYYDLDSKANARAKLTPGALARIYAQEGLFSQAIQEFRAIIASAPSRFDIRVALAETLWRMGHISEAAQVAQSILEQLPYCLKANLILGAAWKETGLAESDLYLQRAQLLDPLNQVAVRLLGPHAPQPALQTSVPRYVEHVEPVFAEPAPSEPPPASTFAEVLAETPVDFAPAEPAIETTIAEEPVAPVTANDSLPAWLRRAPAEPAEKAESPREETSDWVSKLREMPAEEPVPTAPAPAPTIDWLSMPTTEQAAQPQPTEETETHPSWLDSIPSDATTETTPAAESPQAEATPLTPDWMRGLPEIAEPTAPAPSAKSEELPTWLAPSESESTAEEMPAWLAPSSAITEPAPAEEETPTIFAEPVAPAQVVKEPVAQVEEKPTTSFEPVPAHAVEEPAPMPAEIPAPVVEPPAPIAAEIPAIIEMPPPPVIESAEVATTGFEAPVIAEPEPIVVPTATPSIVVELPPSPPVETIVVETRAAPVESKRKRQPKGYGHLVQARVHRDAQRWNDALTEYDYLVQHAPRLVREVIDDLEVLIRRIDVPLEAHRILGDAYTRVDRLAEALERYRFVLEHVS